MSFVKRSSSPYNLHYFTTIKFCELPLFVPVYCQVLTLFDSEERDIKTTILVSTAILQKHYCRIIMYIVQNHCLTFQTEYKIQDSQFFYIGNSFFISAQRIPNTKLLLSLSDIWLIVSFALIAQLVQFSFDGCTDNAASAPCIHNTRKTHV